MKRKKTQANVAILDCCREFRYKATTTRGTTKQALPTFIQPSNSYNDNYSGVLIALACAPNHGASDDGGDGHGSNSNVAFRVDFT